jgi:purine-cytosine permease-like protein
MGVSPVATFMIALGALSRLASGEWNPVLGVQELGLGVPALALIIFATWTTNDKNIYSGGLALTNIFPGVSRWLHTLILGALGTTLGCFRLTRYFTEWLVTLGAVFAPLVGIILADYFIVRRRRPVTEELYREGGVYRYTRGVNMIALIAVAVGVVVGRLTPPSFIQPVASLALTALCYLLGMRFMNKMTLP